MAHNPRKIAAETVYEVTKKKSNLNGCVERCRKDNNLSELDMRFILELASGVLRNLEYIDFLIAEFSDIKINKISPYVLSVLRIGVYQIVFTDRIPNSAAVNESVKLIKKSSNSRLSGFVNAVLRNIEKGYQTKKLPDDRIKFLSVKYSFPEWIVKRWCVRFGEKAEEIFEAMNKKPETILRTNMLKTTCEKLLKDLEKDGWECKKYISSVFPEISNLITAAKVTSLADTNAYKEGEFYVQDAAASFASYVLNPEKGSTVIDMCASPGGKTTHLGEIMENTGRIYAFDVSDAKVSKINENAGRLGITNIEAIKGDSTHFYPEFEEKADYILADVPCSGLGIIRRKPDIKYLRNEEDIRELADLGAKILDNAARYLKSGGKLLFSTCTLEREENEDALFDFLKRHPDFHLEKIECLRENEGYLTFLPCDDNCDGFFISLMKKD